MQEIPWLRQSENRGISPVSSTHILSIAELLFPCCGSFLSVRSDDLRRHKGEEDSVVFIDVCSAFTYCVSRNLSVEPWLYGC